MNASIKDLWDTDKPAKAEVSVCLPACLPVSVPVLVSLSLSLSLCVSVCHTFPSLTQADGTYEEEILWRRASAILTAHNPAVPLFLYLLCENG